MAQKRMTGPPPEDPAKKEGPGLGKRTMPQMPLSADAITKLDDLLVAEENSKKKRKPLPPQCCGILPCKGRTPFCYQCDICMDCITGAGCGHDSSSHSYSSCGGLDTDD